MRPYKLAVHNPVEWNDPVSWIAGLIRCFYKKHYNHVVTVIEQYDKKFIIHAVADGVLMEGYDLWIKNNRRRTTEKIPFNCSFTDEQLTERAILSIGREYNKPTYLSHIIYKFTGVWIGKTGEEAKKSVQCWANVAEIEGDPEFWLATPEMKTV